ncbi:Hypothetical predicted protein [Olea europaea subsp. europaea]|uniref:BLOC-1-related complex subunit 6 C-terminal helix domain-containing protein n=1 Tax=Olea europaea subsp. europaea TaxID=158383 RepID=A0A8S0VLQ8_OLEEU|nr:Hypothetical predicted protein [Olea europaea subsp. europaea]
MGQLESKENSADIYEKEETTPYDGQNEILKSLEVLERELGPNTSILARSWTIAAVGIHFYSSFENVYMFMNSFLLLGATKRSSSESFVSVSVPDPELMGRSESKENLADIYEKEKTMPYDGQDEILKSLEVLERELVAIAGSFTSLFSSLRLVLSQATSTSIDHLNCFSIVAGDLQECVLDAATKGNWYINTCLKINEEMKGIET